MKTKKCTNCKNIFPATTEFFFSNKNIPDGLACWCKRCQKSWAKANSIKRSLYWKKYRQDNKRQKRNTELVLTYGISIDEYEQILKQQDEKCAICGEPETAYSWGKVKSLAVDHDHKSNKVRGLLCNNCNRALGLFKDNIKILEQAAKYLRFRV